MAASIKKKQEEKNLKILRDLALLTHNKQCFDCNQKGPTYVNMTVGSFICTSCSGLLRGMNPPHRVKSISMASFTTEEVEFLKKHGNGLCNKVWLHAFDKNAMPDIKEEAKFRDFLAQKYEKKRWYLPASDDMHNEARRQNELVDDKIVPNKALLLINKTVANDNTKIALSFPTTVPPKSQPQSSESATSLFGDELISCSPPSTAVSVSLPLAPHSQSAITVSAPASSVNKTLLLTPPAQSAVTLRAVKQPNSDEIDLFDVFSEGIVPNGTNALQQIPTVTALNVHTVLVTQPDQSDDGFADFESFDKQMSLQNSSEVADEVPTESHAKAKRGSGQDKYAALAELDTVFGSGSNTLIDWDGSTGVSSLWQQTRNANRLPATADSDIASAGVNGSIPHSAGVFPGSAPLSAGVLPGSAPHSAGVLPGSAPHSAGVLPGSAPHSAGVLPGSAPHVASVPGSTLYSTGAVSGSMSYCVGTVSSQPMLNPSQPMYVPGQPMYAPSQAMYVPGQPMMVPNQSMYPSGQPMVAQGHHVYPAGQPMVAGGHPSMYAANQSMIGGAPGMVAMPAWPPAMYPRPDGSQQHPVYGMMAPNAYGMTVQQLPAAYGMWPGQQTMNAYGAMSMQPSAGQPVSNNLPKTGAANPFS